MTDKLSDNQKKMLDDTVERRMNNTGETRKQAVEHITKFLLTYTQDA